MPYFNNRQPQLLERAMSALCYPSCGLIGLLYLLVSGKHARTQPFFYFHFLQAIILGILTFLLSWTGSAIRHVLLGIFGLIFAWLPGGTALVAVIGSAIDWLLLLVNSVIYILMIYGFVFALLGKYAEIPRLSAMVRKNM